MSRVTFIYDSVYPWCAGGVEKRVWEIGRRLARVHQHHVEIVGMRWWLGPQVIERDGVIIRGICNPVGLYSGRRRSIMQAIYFAASLAAKLRLDSDIVDCQHFPYIHVFPARLRASLSRIPFVLTVHEVWDRYWHSYMGMLGGAGRLVEQMAVRGGGKIVAVSQRVKSQLVDLGVGAERVTVIPNGVDFQRIRDTQPCADSWDIIYVGRLAPHKNVDLLLQAVGLVCKQVNSLKCAIVGTGPEFGNLVALSNRLGLQGVVCFFGYVSEEQVYRILRSGRVFVMPSSREGFSVATLEANAAGLPCLVSSHEQNSAQDLVVDGENGFRVPLSAEAFAGRILDLLRDTDLWRYMSKRSVEVARNYDWEVVTQKAEQFYALL